MTLKVHDPTMVGSAEWFLEARERRRQMHDDLRAWNDPSRMGYSCVNFCIFNAGEVVAILMPEPNFIGSAVALQLEWRWYEAEFEEELLHVTSLCGGSDLTLWLECLRRHLADVDAVGAPLREALLNGTQHLWRRGDLALCVNALLY
jgi:hypothetical protein